MEDSIPCGQEARAVSHQSLADCTLVLWLRKEAVLATVSHQLRPVFIIFRIPDSIPERLYLPPSKVSLTLGRRWE